jgi:hypothetical protein
MSEGLLESRDFDRYLSLSEKSAHDEAIAANDAFTAAMNKAIGKRREKATPGTFVDHTPPIGAKRLYGDVIMSPCGSPAAMCMESGGAQAGAETMK